LELKRQKLSQKRRKKMALWKRLENILSAVAFAEEGDLKTAKMLLEEEIEHDDPRELRPQACDDADPTLANT
jgi:hypothetical protein